MVDYDVREDIARRLKIQMQKIEDYRKELSQIEIIDSIVEDVLAQAIKAVPDGCIAISRNRGSEFIILRNTSPNKNYGFALPIEDVPEFISDIARLTESDPTRKGYNLDRGRFRFPFSQTYSVLASVARASRESILPIYAEVYPEHNPSMN